ncbi:MAG TPA: Do family serine endopeptidase [Candidatus Sulfotelmatobacter sp.]|nr:Do family serine endopeptidase [Candidatus Sulfotelmatobacter sp.]
MSSLKEYFQTKIVCRLIAPLLAGALAASVGVYELAKPVHAAVAEPAAAAAPLDDNSVSALLSLDHAMEALAARVTPAVVNITVTSKNRAASNELEGDQGNDSDQNGEHFFGPFGGINPFKFFGDRSRPQIEHGLGSGVIISPDGYIVTNNHVIDGAVDIRVTMSDRRVFPAKLVGADPLTDLAVVKIKGSNFASVPLGDSTKLLPGQSVLAFGNPFGFRFTVTRGIVSALNRPNPDPTNRRKPGEFIQTDAAINPGNSGGPLVDAHGEVIGINTFLISGSGSFSGMGFAIPTQIVRPTVDELIHSGKVAHGYMGIGISDVTPENSKFFDLTKSAGAVVSQVEPDSPAAKAGLKTGDVITGLNGKAVNDAGELQVDVGQMKPSTTIHLDVMRNGKSENIPVTLEAMGSRDETTSAKDENGRPRWGLGLEDLTPEVRQQLQAPSDVHGAVVANVQPGSSAEDAGIQRGDVIVEVNRKAVHSSQDVKDALGSVPNGQDALVLVWSNGGSTYRVLHPTQG